MMKRTTIAGLMLAATAACFSVTSAFAVDANTVAVKLWNKNDGSQGMSLSTDHAKAGKVTFTVQNTSSNMVHEFLIVKTDMAFDQFPIDPNNPAAVDESKLQGVKELSSDLDPGKAGALTLDLTPGRYVVFCNQPGHFAAGMHLAFNVE
ncbi:MAG TPA: hypothetical protein VMT54_21660 [Candidatus Cybelea sp.]|nr:hypothetical protein [Candidatus Cybelea sp.]